MFLLNDKPLALDTPFTVGEGDEAIQYPANWLRLASPEERAAIGITEAADPEQYDQRFYWGPGNPKDLDVLKMQWISQIKDTAGKILAQSDWMFVRKLERGIDIPADVAVTRGETIAECNRLEAVITECADVEALIEVINGQSWPSTQAER